MEKIKLFVLFLAVLLFSTALVLASETGEIIGVVQDSEGKGLPGVEISIEGKNLQGIRTVMALSDGEFRFPLLPIGEYTLSFYLKGFVPHVQKQVIVRLGRVTDIDVTLRISSLQEEVTVTASAPLVDKTSADTSYYLNSDYLEKLPGQNRTVVDAVKFTPGVTGVRVNTRKGISEEGQPSFRGEGQEGNNWIVDGLCISGVRLRNSGIRLNFDSVEEIQVISDPFSPEYGSAYGGIINMVTKTGSNDLSGEFSLVFMDKSLQSSRLEQLSVVSQPDYFSNYDWYLNLGGPIVKDKLWFFVSDNVFSDAVQTSDGYMDYLYVPGGEKSTVTNNLFAKVTYAFNSSHNLSATGVFQKSLSQKGGIGVPELFETKDFADHIIRVNYRGILNNSTLVEAGLGYIDRNQFIHPMDDDLGPSMYYIEDLGRNINNSYGTVTDDQNRLDFSLKFTKYFDIENFGKHEVKIGLEYYDFSSKFNVDFTGKDEDIFPDNDFDSGTKYYFESWEQDQRTPSFFYEYGLFDFVNSSTGLGFYFTDQVTWGRASFMAGIRSQTQTCLDHQGNKLFAWGIGDFLSPRFSLSVDVTGDSRNIIKLGWGRFSDVITTMPLGLLNSGAGLTFRTYRWNGVSDPDSIELHEPSNWIFENEQKSQPFEIASGIKPNFLNRFLIEYDRRIGRNWAFAARFVRSKADDLLEVLAVFDPIEQYKFLFDNFEHKRRDYSGLEFELNGKIGSQFYLNASYSHSLARGTNPGQSETGSWSQEEGSTNYLGLFGNHIFIPDIPELSEIKEYYDWALGGLGGRGIGDEGWYGKLPYSVDHNFKLLTVFIAPYGIHVSAALEWISGYYWEKMGYVPFFGGYYSYPETRGSRKTPGHHYLDLGIEKEWALKKLGLSLPVTAVLRVDVLNVLNSQKPVSFVKEDIPIFGQVWGRQQPRQARMSFKIKW
ncbi:MAG: TonB-dependent receptor plug domain-containing protein [Candidatus Aminicenantes bacterium]|nr:TonB-dependent receptor plug domain-containing protein [Candidatus Aminicenantes bacterium]